MTAQSLFVVSFITALIILSYKVRHFDVGSAITLKHVVYLIFGFRDSLLDTLFVLYEELNNDAMRKDKNVQQFLEKCKTTAELFV